MKALDKVLVTGASRGLGKAIALELARRGYHVIAGMRDLSAAYGAPAGQPGRIEAQALDLAALGDWRPPEDLKVLVNNAGYRGPYLPIEEVGPDEWRRTFEVNVFGLAEVSRRAIPALRSTRGVLCNIGSMGVYMPAPFYSVYRASKVAAAALSEGLRIELAPFGVRVIDVPIGGVDTDMMRSSIVHRPPEAIEYPLYRPMAEQQMAMQEGVRLRVCPPREAARSIADEIERDGPLRRACDPNAVTGLAHVEATTEEQRAQDLLGRFGHRPGAAC